MISQPDGPPDRGGQVQEQLRVPRGSVGVIIGKGGETIRDIQNETGARIQFIGKFCFFGAGFSWSNYSNFVDNPQDNEKTCLISGRPPQVQEAKRMVEGLLANSAQMQKQGPPIHQQRYECEEIFRVPASRTGVVIGKGFFKK
jgi:far upstream element-binding protein